MRAIRIHETGGPEVLRLDEVPTPEAGPGQVLVKTHSIGIGIADQLVRTGRYPWMPPLPTIPGIELSGTIAAVGPGITTLHEGDPVVVSAVPERNCYAEYLAIDAEWAFPCPPGFDLAIASCLMNYRVAYRILHAAARVRAGETIAIVGAAGGVGSALLQLAKAADLETIALVRSAAKAAFASGQGAVHVIDTSREDLHSRIDDITRGRGVDLIVDPVGGDGFINHLDLLAPVGMQVLYGMIDGLPQADVFKAQAGHWARSPAVRLFSIHAYDAYPDITGADMALLMDMVLQRRIDPVIHAELPLEMAREAHEMLDANAIIGKVLLQPHRTEPRFTL